MTDHLTAHEREATRAAAIVAFTISALIVAVWLACVVLHALGQPIITAPAHGVFPAGIAATIAACFGWAQHTTRIEQEKPNGK